MHITVSHYAAPARLQLRRRQPRLAPCPVHEPAGSAGWRVRLVTVVVALIAAALCLVDADVAASFADNTVRRAATARPGCPRDR
jgi:hypothetical protein